METKTVKLLAAAASSFAAAALLILLAALLPTVRRRKISLVVGAAATATCTLSILIYLLIYRLTSGRRRLSSVSRKLAISGADNHHIQIHYSFLRKVAGLPVSFPYRALELATAHFSTPIARGSSGSVFRGVLPDGTPIAVKRIDRPEDQGDKEFRSEIAAIAGVQHVNLVRLLGYCIRPADAANHRLLVYEFAPHGSLDKWIFRRVFSSDRCLPWRLRYRVAVEVGKALAYLHHDCRSRVLHLDIKPENILLDEGFHALVADFGLSKIMGRDESRVLTSLRGTRGYLAPEWLLDRGASEKSDVFSYGMVLLELVGGRRNCRLVEEDSGGGAGSSRLRWSYFPATVVEKVRQGRVMEVVDERMMAETAAAEEEVRRLVYVGLWCIQEEPKLRPSMATVVDMLEKKTGVEPPPLETSMTMAEYLGIDMPEGVAATGGAPPVAEAAVFERLESGYQPPAVSAYSLAVSVLSGR